MIRRKKYIWMVISGVILIIFFYFVKIVFIDNKEVVLNVLVLDVGVDVENIKQDLDFCLKPDKNQRIEITEIDPSIPENWPIILTWIRSRTFDLFLADENQIKSFANKGCFFSLNDLLVNEFEGQYEFYESDLLEYDDEGNVKVIGSKKAYGIYIRDDSQLHNMQKPIAAIVINAPNKDNAIKVLKYWSKSG